jgi:hypothetical protein
MPYTSGDQVQRHVLENDGKITEKITDTKATQKNQTLGYYSVLLMCEQRKGIR